MNKNISKISLYSGKLLLFFLGFLVDEITATFSAKVEFPKSSQKQLENEIPQTTLSPGLLSDFPSESCNYEFI